MDRPLWINKLNALQPCPEAMKYALTHKTLASAWAKCERAEWMLWLIGKTMDCEAERKTLVLVACGCARTALKYVPSGEKRPLAAIEIAERWAMGDATVTLEMVTRAASAAFAASATSTANANAFAAFAAFAASAASAANANAFANASAAYAAAAANAAAYSAAFADAKKECADIVRAYYPRAPKLTLAPKKKRKKKEEEG